jgi:HEAT repeat protein
LGEHHDKTALGALVQVFADNPAPVRIEAARALAKLTPDARADILEKFSATDDQRRPGVAWAISKAGRPGVAELLPHLKNDDARHWAVEGVWWKPGDPRRLPGTLMVSPSQGLSLSLVVDDLDAPRPIQGPIGVDEAERSGLVMLGLTSDGRQYTLWDGYFSSGNPWSSIFRSVGRKELHFNRGGGPRIPQSRRASADDAGVEDRWACPSCGLA